MPSGRGFSHYCRTLRQNGWLYRVKRTYHGQQELPLIWRGLQLSVSAAKDQSEVTGVIPEYAPDRNHADVRPVVSKGYPFMLTVTLPR